LSLFWGIVYRLAIEAIPNSIKTATKTAPALTAVDSAPSSVAIAAPSIKTTAKPRAIGQFRVICLASTGSDIRTVDTTTEPVSMLGLLMGFARTSRIKVEAAKLDFLVLPGDQDEPNCLLA
jgi:hypothetical protein